MPRPKNSSEPDYLAIRNYLKHNTYPENYSKNEKKCLRVASKTYGLRGQDLVKIRADSTSKIVIESEDRRQLLVQCTHEGLGESIEAAALGGHLGRDSTIARLTTKYWWPKMWVDIENYVKNCERCQKNSNKFDKAGDQLHSIPVQPVPMQQVGIDICSLSVASDGYVAIVVLIDYFTKFTIARAVKDKTAMTVCHFIYEEVICKYGCPNIQINDQGREFVNTVATRLQHMTGTKQRITSAYHPQVNTDSQLTVIHYMLFGLISK